MTKSGNLKKIFQILFGKKLENVFFSENKNYQKYYINYINCLLEKNYKVTYLSSEKNDFINNDKVENIYIGKGLIRSLIFRLICCKFFYLTIIDLDNNELKKSKNVNEYIYIFHAAVSSHRAYSASAFNNYDTICCLGQFHNNEIKKLELNNSIKTKKLINSGYFYFDYLKSNYKENINPKKILIAPSWNYSPNSFFDKYIIDYINYLLEKKESVILRPHNEHLKRSLNKINEIKSLFLKNDNFEIDLSDENIYSIQDSKVLITDYSGIALEYILVIKKPVIFVNSEPKIHNQNFSDISNFTIEDTVRKEFGLSIDSTKLNQLEEVLNKSKYYFNNDIKKKIDNFLYSNYYNVDKTCSKTLKTIYNLN